MIGIQPPSAVPPALGDAALLDALREAMVRRRAAYADELALLAEIDARGLALDQGYPTAAALVRDLYHLGMSQAQRMVAHAHALHPKLTPSGGQVDAELPRTATALREGEIGPEHVDAIRAAVDALPRATTAEDRVAAERILCEAATQTEPRLLTKLGREIRDRLDPDGTAPREADLAQPRRALHLAARRDGGVRGSFELDAEAGTLLRNLLSPLAAPRGGQDGPDPRTTAERHGDALAEIVALAARSPEAPGEAGEPVTLLVTARLDDLNQQLGQGVLDGVQDLSIAQIRRLACDCHAAPVIFGSRGEPLDLGRTTRLVSRALRRALILRDQGCAFPGRDRKPKWCHAHHIRHWADGGPTTLANLVLLCPHHHRVLHHTSWQVRLVGGIPWFVPPPHVDPRRRPRRNTLHTRHPAALAA